MPGQSFSCLTAANPAACRKEGSSLESLLKEPEKEGRKKTQFFKGFGKAGEFLCVKICRTALFFFFFFKIDRE